MKKIAIFHPVDDRYGASKILAYVLSFLSQEYQCDVYIPKLTHEIDFTLGELSENNDKVNFIEFPCAPLVHRGMYSLKGLINWGKQNVQTYTFLKKNRKKYSAVYINTVALFSIALICKLLSIRNIVHCHEYLKGSVYGEVIRKVVLFSADRIICVSNKVASYIGASRKVDVVHNGIPDIEHHHLPIVSDYIDGHMNFAMVGRVMPEKGQWFLCDAVKAIPHELLRNVKIHVYGDAPPTRPHLFAEFRELVVQNKLSEVFVLHGFDSQASQKAATLDVCVIPSMMVDPFPTTVIEGLRAAKVVLTTDNGGASEIIKDKVNGFLIKHGDVENFTYVLSSLIKLNHEEIKNIQSQARLTYELNFTIKKFQERFESVFKRFVQNND